MDGSPYACCDTLCEIILEEQEAALEWKCPTGHSSLLIKAFTAPHFTELWRLHNPPDTSLYIDLCQCWRLQSLIFFYLSTVSWCLKQSKTYLNHASGHIVHHSVEGLRKFMVANTWTWAPQSPLTEGREADSVSHFLQLGPPESSRTFQNSGTGLGLDGGRDTSHSNWNILQEI